MLLLHYLHLRATGHLPPRAFAHQPFVIDWSALDPRAPRETANQVLTQMLRRYVGEADFNLGACSKYFNLSIIQE